MAIYKNQILIQSTSPVHTLLRSNHLTELLKINKLEQLNRNNSLLFQITFVYFGLNLYVYLAAFGDFLNKSQTPLQ